MEHKMTDTKQIKIFVLAGKAVFTVRSATSGKHWTFKITAKKGKPAADDNETFFVSLMVAPEHFEYLGYISKQKYNTSSKSCRKPDANEHTIIRHLLGYIERGRLNSNFEFYHEGTCARCGRPLTDPESIKRGLGPTCAGRK